MDALIRSQLSQTGVRAAILLTRSRLTPPAVGYAMESAGERNVIRHGSVGLAAHGGDGECRKSAGPRGALHPEARGRVCRARALAGRVVGLPVPRRIQLSMNRLLPSPVISPAATPRRDCLFVRSSRARRLWLRLAVLRWTSRLERERWDRCLRLTGRWRRVVRRCLRAVGRSRRRDGRCR